MPRPCHRTHLDPVLHPQCKSCILWLTNTDQRVRWGGPFELGTISTITTPSMSRKELIQARLNKVPCVHLGDLTGESRRCEECGRTHKLIPLYSCPVKGPCSVDGRVKSAQHCLRCNSYVPRGSRELDLVSADDKEGERRDVT